MQFDRELYALYQDGKLKRYQILFAVNGGAFAVYQFASSQSVMFAIGLPLLMTVFTCVMSIDIHRFGVNMAENVKVAYAYQKPGRRVLLVICSALALGWLAGFAEAAVQLSELSEVLCKGDQ